MPNLFDNPTVLVHMLRGEAAVDPELPASGLLIQAAKVIEELEEKIDFDKVDRVATAVRTAVYETLMEIEGFESNTHPMYVANDGFSFLAETAHETWQVTCLRAVHARPTGGGDGGSQDAGSPA